MNITATKNTTGQTLDVVIANDGTQRILFHTIEKVSGVDVTHGGANATEFLRYADTIDGTNQTSELNIRASANGEAVIKAKVHAYLPSDLTAFDTALDEFEAQYTATEIQNGEDSEGNSITSPAYPTPIELISSNITLVFNDSRGIHQFD
jgi:hypothetical protein